MDQNTKLLQQDLIKAESLVESKERHFNKEKYPKSFFWNICILIFGLFLLSSCNGQERKVKKFFLRVNANEINKSSKYIWPDDHSKLYVFNLRFLEKNPLANFEVLETEKINVEGKKYLKATIKCLNFPPELIDYFDILGKKDGEIIIDTFEIKKANNREYISLNWDWFDSEIPKNLKMASVSSETLNLRSGPGVDYKVISQLKMNDEIIIDANFNNTKWRKGLVIEGSSINTVYFSSELSNAKEISFFSLGYFGNISILLLLIIGIAVWFLVYPIVLIGSFKIIGDFDDNALTVAIIIFVLIAGSLYFTYQILENLLFEMFLINLPL